MSVTSRLLSQIVNKRSFLCIGLDSDISKIPEHLRGLEDPILEFNKAIIESTHDLCVSFKINTAFYEAMGPKGWVTLQRTLELIPDNIFTIADAKRGDIGNTGSQYAKAFFEAMSFDSVTVAPYMGRDSIAPFLEYPDRVAIALGLTSNPGSQDLQLLDLNKGIKLYEENIRLLTEWGNPNQLMLVVGATHPERLRGIRKIAPQHFYLVPGVGAQGGSLQDVCLAGLNDQVGLLINVSRGIIYSGKGKDFASEARRAAEEYQAQMQKILEAQGFL